MESLAGLVLLLLLARAFGIAAERLRQAPAAGELVAGVVLAAAIMLAGDTVPMLLQLRDGMVLDHVTDVAMLFIVLLAGLELRPREIARHSATSFAVALGGAAVPLALGVALAWWYLPDSADRPAQAFLVGVAMSITAIATTVRVLENLGLLHARVGETIVAAAIFDDVIGIVLLAVLTALIQTGSLPEPAAFAWLLGKVVLFFAITVALGVHVYPHVHRRVGAMEIAVAEFSLLMLVAMAYAALADWLGMHWILGAFMAGLYFEPERVGPKAYNEMRLIVGGVTNGFLGPIFFAAIGLAVDLRAVIAAPGFAALLIACAFAGKLVGAGVPARLAGLGGREAAAVGIGMSGRGAVELVILSIAWEAGLFHDGPMVEQLFPALVLMAVVTTLIVPLALRRVLPPGGGTHG